MKYPTVSSLCEGIAESIRRKEGSTEKINPQDFVERINALSIGGGGEEYGVYLKILDVDCNIDSGISSTLTSDSPEVVEFFSDAFSLGAKHYRDGTPTYSHDIMYEQLAKVAIEAKRKEMGMPSRYDALQKKVPLLALRTKDKAEEDGFGERLIILSNINDLREATSGANSGTIYCQTSPIGYELGYDDINTPGTVVWFSPEGIRIYNFE